MMSISLALGVLTKKFDENSVTPGWVGFAITFVVAAIVVLLCIDMVRRVRRVRYRGEIREQLEAEREAAEQAGTATNGSTKPGPKN